MKRTRVLSCILAVALLASLAACAPATEGTASETGTPEPVETETEEVRPFALPIYREDAMHPVLGDNRTNLTIAPLLYEGLFELDESFEPCPVLCKSDSVSEDGLVWSFVLQSGVTFSDGTPLTAADVAAALELARGSARYAARLKSVRSVAEEDGRVIVTLSAPSGNLPALLDIPIAKGEEDWPAGTGPYARSTSGDSLVLRQNWWQNKRLPLEKILLTEITQTDDLIRSFDTRTTSLIVADLTGTNVLGFSNSYEARSFDTTTMLYLGFNSKKGDCIDETVRRALACGIDRGTIATSIYARHVTASALPVSPKSSLYDETLGEGIAYSVSTMQSLLADVKGGVKVTFVVNSESSFKTAAAEYLATQWENVGVTVTLKKLAWDDYLAALKAGTFDVYLGETTLTGDFNLTDLVGTRGSLNYGGFSNSETDALLAAFQAADAQGRRAAAAALYTNLTEQLPIATLCFKSDSVLTEWGVIGNINPTRQNAFFEMENWSIYQESGEEAE